MGQYLRKATIEDRDLLFQWANDPLVRKNSFSTAEIAYEEHVDWYNRVLVYSIFTWMVSTRLARPELP